MVRLSNFRNVGRKKCKGHINFENSKLVFIVEYKYKCSRIFFKQLDCEFIRGF